MPLLLDGAGSLKLLNLEIIDDLSEGLKPDKRVMKSRRHTPMIMLSVDDSRIERGGCRFL